MAQKATPDPKGWADVRKAAAQTAVKASEKTGRPVDERVKKLAVEHLYHDEIEDQRGSNRAKEPIDPWAINDRIKAATIRR
jgi:hypothetical protein